MLVAGEDTDALVRHARAPVDRLLSYTQGVSGSVTVCVYSLHPWLHVKVSAHSVTSSVLPGRRMVLDQERAVLTAAFFAVEPSELPHGQGLPGSCLVARSGRRTGGGSRRGSRYEEAALGVAPSSACPDAAEKGCC
ncbi:hypothetical protein ACODT5_22455 [Streptomyces sp. 5.8]|uniref:hypothetical protein n=1 Tax=Streptomyces sp. 5.8 TaxID=3406571 RepID=UPI003BB5EC47